MKNLPAIAGGQPIRSQSAPLVFGAPDIGEAEVEAIAECVRRGWVGTGPKVGEFESAFAEYKGAPCAVAVSSCTAALKLSLKTLGIGPGDEVITPTLTFCAALHNIMHVGATPVLVDSDPGSLNMASDFSNAISDRTRAIIVMHYAGRCCEMDAIMALARKHDLVVIEDCAHAIESVYRDQPSGLIGDVGCFSFYPTKNMTTIEGGMVVTRDKQLADRVRTLAQQGMSLNAWARHSGQGFRPYDIIAAGFKNNMTDIQAAVGLVQLGAVTERHRRRAALWEHYQRGLAGLPCVRPLPVSIEGGDVHALHLYTIQIDTAELSIDRDRVIEALGAEHIGTGVHYPPLHLTTHYRQVLGLGPGDFPHAERASERLISLPFGSNLSEGDIDEVCYALDRIFRYYAR